MGDNMDWPMRPPQAPRMPMDRGFYGSPVTRPVMPVPGNGPFNPPGLRNPGFGFPGVGVPQRPIGGDGRFSMPEFGSPVTRPVMPAPPPQNALTGVPVTRPVMPVGGTTIGRITSGPFTPNRDTRNIRG